MSRLFVLADAPCPETPQAMQVLFAPGEDLIGVLTDVIDLPDSPESADPWRHLAHVSAIQKSLIDERLPPITGLAATDVGMVFDEVAPESAESDEVLVDGVPVDVDTLTYRGLNFALGRDIRQFPFAILRPAASTGPWPPLTSIPG